MWLTLHRRKGTPTLYTNTERLIRELQARRNLAEQDALPAADLEAAAAAALVTLETLCGYTDPGMFDIAS